MFDFANVQPRTLEVKLLDGRVLNLTTPTKKGVDQFVETYKTAEKTNVGKPETVKKLYAAFADTLSVNAEGVKITAEDLGDYSLDCVLGFVVEYANFIVGATSDPN